MTEYGIRSKENKYLIFLHYPLFKVQAPAELWIAQGVLLERLAHMGHQVPVPTFRMSLLTVKSVIADRDNELTGEPVVARKWSEEEEKHKT